jgi:hypothetical protein
MLMSQGRKVTEMFEVVCYNAQGSAFHRFTTDKADTAELMTVLPDETFGVLIHNATTGAYIGRA